MTIFRKEHVAPHLTELETFYARLQQAVRGVPGSPGVAEQYHASTDQFATDYVDIDLVQVEKAIGHFKVEVDALKHLKGLAQKPVHRP
ncbi:MAG TPA: hypothetical protein PLR02_07390 [Rhodocyclaceae bacterium]|nr:hypothetical protein [Rhodocyclaceae bacterium]